MRKGGTNSGATGGSVQACYVPIKYQGPAFSEPQPGEELTDLSRSREDRAGEKKRPEGQDGQG